MNPAKEVKTKIALTRPGLEMGNKIKMKHKDGLRKNKRIMQPL